MRAVRNRTGKEQKGTKEEEKKMASINGLTVKKLKYFEGKEGAAAQGDLYLGNKKIAFWSQDANGCIEDNLDMEPGYSEQKLRQAIIAAHPEKHEEKIAQNGVPYTLDYELEFLMADLLSPIETEKAWKRAVKAGYVGLFEIADGFHYKTWYLSKWLYESGARTVEAVKAEIPKPQLDQALDSMFKNERLKESVFWSKEDFVIGTSLELGSVMKDATKKGEC